LKANFFISSVFITRFNLDLELGIWPVCC